MTLDAGTGLVHTAPAHGQDDYLLGLTNDLDLSCPVTELGKYDSSVEILSKQLKGLEVLGDGNDKMLELLHEKNHIKKQSKFQHSYPYDWRTKKPVILRGSKQWFMDTGSLQVSYHRLLKKGDIHYEPSMMSQGKTPWKDLPRPRWI